MKKPFLSKSVTAEDAAAMRDAGLVKNGKAVMGSSRHWQPGKPGKRIFFLEDGAELMQDDTGKTLTKWD